MPARSIPWPRILAEGFAIVVSILLAFGIQAWWEGRQERRAEAAYLAAIHEEIARNLVALEGNINVAEGRDAALRHAARLLDAELYADSAEAFVVSMVLGSRTAGPPRVATAVFDELSSTGGIVVIQDLDLRRAILELYAVTETRFERMNDASEQVGARLNALVTRHVPPEVILRGPTPNDFSVDTQAVSAAELVGVAESIAQDPALLGEMRAAFSDHRDSQIVRLRHKEDVLEVLDLLAASLP